MDSQNSRDYYNQICQYEAQIRLIFSKTEQKKQNKLRFRLALEVESILGHPTTEEDIEAIITLLRQAL